MCFKHVCLTTIGSLSNHAASEEGGSDPWDHETRRCSLDSLYFQLPHPPFHIPSATSSGPRFLRSTWHPDSGVRGQNAQEYQVANSQQFLESMCVQRCTKCVLLYPHCHFYSQTFSSNDLMDRFHHLVHLPWPLILPSKGCTSQAAFATSSKGSQMTTFPGGSTARTAATPDTPRKEGRLCCQLPLKLTCRKVPETCKFQSSKT